MTSLSASRLWFALQPSRCHTSTDDAASWNQAYIPPIPLPAVEDPEGVDPSDTSPPAVAGEAVALLHGNTTHSTNFNDNSSAGDNINKTGVGHVYQHHRQLSTSTPLPPTAVAVNSTPLYSHTNTTAMTTATQVLQDTPVPTLPLPRLAQYPSHISKRWWADCSRSSKTTQSKPHAPSCPPTTA